MPDGQVEALGQAGSLLVVGFVPRDVDGPLVHIHIADLQADHFARAQRQIVDEQDRDQVAPPLGRIRSPQQRRKLLAREEGRLGLFVPTTGRGTPIGADLRKRRKK